MTWFENFDLDNIVTPVKVKILKRILKEVGYNPKKTKYLIRGFSKGFSIGYKGKRVGMKQVAPNLPIRVGSETHLWNKVMKEVKLKRYAGPFEEPPFDSYIQSPIGLVPKDNGKDTRLIFHLSFPRNSKNSDVKSVNECIPESECSVHYPDFQEAIKLCQEAGKFCFASKSDMKSAFRNLPLLVKNFCLLLMKAKNPQDGKTYWFVEKCLPFGSGSSCKIFQEFSDAIAFVITKRTRKENVNYLDDFLFIAFLKECCNFQVNSFIDLCKEINFPVAMEKTVWADQIIVFLGLLIDNVNQVVCIPFDKIQRAKEMILAILKNKKRKTTVLQIQRLTGFLNFLCKCVIPGRVFTIRLYSLVSSKLQPHHHVKIPLDIVEDLKMWLEFLEGSQCYYRPFMDFLDWTADDILMYSDASLSNNKGFGAWCQNDWMAHKWSECNDFIIDEKPSIAYVELFALTAGVLQWIHRFANRRIWLFIDNKSARDMVNDSASHCKNCMVLIRLITLQSMKYNVRINAKYIESKKNVLSDALSRDQMHRFWKYAPKTMNTYRTQISNRIWPIQKIWIK